MNLGISFGHEYPWSYKHLPSPLVPSPPLKSHNLTVSKSQHTAAKAERRRCEELSSARQSLQLSSAAARKAGKKIDQMATALLIRYMRRRDLHCSSLPAYRSVFPLASEMLQSAHQMVREAHVHAQKDKGRKKLIGLRNNMDTTTHSTEKSLGEYRRRFTFSKGKSAGRNSSGRITIFHRGGGSKRLHRKIDLKRSTSSMGIVEKIDYDPNRSSRVALVRWTEVVQLGQQRKCNAVEDFAQLQEILEPTLTAISSSFSFSSLLDQRRVACFAPGLTMANVVIGSINSEGGAGSKKTCAKDVFFSALSSPKAKGETSSLSVSRSSGFPRIAVAGAKPAFFALRMKENVGGKNTFSLSEIQMLDTDSVIWAHRIKRKAAVSWQSFRQQESLGLVGAPEDNESKPKT